MSFACVDDLEPRTHFSAPPLGTDPQMCAVGAALYFSASTAKLGMELWKSDGSARGTVLVRDLVPGAASSMPENLIAAGSRLFFQASDGRHNAIWTSGGSAGTTFKLRAGLLESATAVGRVLLFVTPHNLHHELWRSDGTKAGTRMLMDHLPGEAMLVSAGKAAFLSLGDRILSLDGTKGGIRSVYDAPGEAASGFSHLGSKLLFLAPDGVQQRLWAANATTAAPIGPAPWLELSNTATVGPKLYFLKQVGGAAQLWASDGTAGGTRLVAPLATPTRNGIDPDVPADPMPRLASANGQVLAFYRYGSVGQNAMELRRIDPDTGEQTLFLTWTPIITPDNDHPSVGLSSFASISGGMVFNVRQSIDDPAQAWFSDGTLAGTRAILPRQFQIDSPVAATGRLFFTHDNSASDRRRLWVWNYGGGTGPRQL